MVAAEPEPKLHSQPTRVPIRYSESPVARQRHARRVWSLHRGTRQPMNGLMGWLVTSWLFCPKKAVDRNGTAIATKKRVASLVRERVRDRHTNTLSRCDQLVESRIVAHKPARRSSI